MTEIREGDLTFSFPDQCEAGKYDDWAFYRNQFQSAAGGSKAVDVLCLADGVAWLVEIKDYRQHPRTKLIDLCGLKAIDAHPAVVDRQSPHRGIPWTVR